MKDLRSELMNYYHVEPEVAGQLGQRTEFLSTFPTTVGKMEYLFDRWPADEFVQAHPCFAVSQRIKEKIEQARLTGYQFQPILVGMTDYFEGEHKDIPAFFRLIPTGIPFNDDFGLNSEHQLIASQNAKVLLDGMNLSECVFEMTK